MYHSCNHFAAWWGVAGVCALLSYAIWRLALITMDAFAFELHWYHWSIMAANTAFMAYTEGYKGFHLAFSPRVAARARYLQEQPNRLRSLLAPLFVMGYFHATPRRLFGVYALTIGIVMLILIFNQLAQPWRGILDFGVVVGLSWGVVSTLGCFLKTLGDETLPWAAETPDENQARVPGEF